MGEEIREGMGEVTCSASTGEFDNFDTLWAA
jgi:hypothetical protein